MWAALFSTVQWLSNGTRGVLHRTFATISVLLPASSNLLGWVSSGTKPPEFGAETDPAKLPNISLSCPRGTATTCFNYVRTAGWLPCSQARRCNGPISGATVCSSRGRLKAHLGRALLRTPGSTEELRDAFENRSCESCVIAKLERQPATQCKENVKS